MKQKSGSIFVDKESTFDESRDTTEWLLPNNNKSIISSSSSDDFNTPIVVLELYLMKPIFL